MQNVNNWSIWTKLIETFNEIFRGQPTRLGVFESDGGRITDYWLESGLPLEGLDMECRADLPCVRIVTGDYTHEIANVRKLKFTLTAAGDENGVDIVDDNGRTAVLRIEKTANRAAS